MDTVIIQLATGLGLASAVGWFAPIYFGVVNVLPLLLTLFLYADRNTELSNKLKENSRFGVENDAHESQQQQQNSYYDFIVVGAGSAGSIVASRLSKHFNVLLLERGGEPNPLTVVPGLQPTLLGNTQLDYRYRTVPQNNSYLAGVNRETFWNAGMGLGGGSILNGMVYVRGHPFDFDRWARVANDERWKYENVVPYFRRSERLCVDCEMSTGVAPSINPKYHGYDGELPMRPASMTPMAGEFLQALEWAGVKKGDTNAPYYKEIADAYLHNHIRGRRVTAYQAFVEPNIGKSLKVVKYARVMQIIFEPGSSKAIGVKYERFGKIEVVKVKKEVILCAGTIETPKLLMLSGIGPEKDLRELGIPVRCDLPVGRNLQSHVYTLLGPFLINKPISVLTERDLNEEAADAYLKNGTGLFSIMFAQAHAMWISNYARRSGEANWPDIQVHAQAAGVSQGMDVELSDHFNYKRDLLRQFLDPVKGNDAFVINVNYARPKSVGTVSLKSNNYLDDPLIDPRFYSDPGNVDAQVTVEGIQRAVYIAENAPVYKRLGARLSPVPFPSCKHLPHKSRDYWHCYIRHITMAFHHFSCTAAMGSVVDSELRVIGATGLRVIDASIMPFVTSANTYAPAMMIAERGSDFVIDSYYHN